MSNSPKLSKEELRKARLRAMGQSEDKSNLVTEGSQAEVISSERHMQPSTSWVVDNAISVKIFDIIAFKDLPWEDMNRWFLQNFSFCSFPPFGLRQRQGGPCGVLAAVQAEIIREILFSPDHPNVSLEIPSAIPKEANIIHLAIALTRILHRASSNGLLRLVDF